MNPITSRQRLHRSWFVLIEENGRRKLRLRWTAYLASELTSSESKVKGEYREQ